jgi:ribonuclease PH
VLKALPLTDHVAAVSCGICEGVAVLDLDYQEDCAADADANFVFTASGAIVEVQGTAEQKPFSEEKLLELLRLARRGIGEIIGLQRQALGLA